MQRVKGGCPTGGEGEGVRILIHICHVASTTYITVKSRLNAIYT